jgi:hypothetical protein
MQRSARLLTFLTLLVGACGDKGGEMEDSNASASSTMSSMSGIALAMPTADSETNPTTDGSATVASDTMIMGSESSAPTEGGSTTFDPNDCGEAQIMIPIVTPNVMLVLDKSGSMVADPNGYWDHDNDPMTPTQTRWQSLHDTVDFIVNTFNNSMNLGMNLFPSKSAKADYSEAACPVNTMVEVPVGPMNAAAILAAMPAADDTTIKGGTPSAKGVKAALAELVGVQSDQPKFMILVTDGAANCQENAPDTDTLFEMYDEDLPTVVADAFSMEIPTYVIGIGIKDETSGMTKDGNPDNTNSYERLNEVAVAGGKPRPGADKYYDTQNQLELQAALEEISQQILSCEITLEPPPKYWEYVEVTVNGVPYGNGKMQVSDCAMEDGWMYTDDTHTAIILCGQACEDFQMTGALDAQYRCPNSG